jgi:hypothetical protein
MSVICARSSKVLRSSFIKTVEINHEAQEGHEEFAGASERLSHNRNLVILAIFSIKLPPVELSL